MTHTARTTIRNAAPLIARREAFDAGSLTARTVRWMPSSGRLSEDLVHELREDIATNREADADTYVVYSYGTPIAWSRVGIPTLTIPNDRYSVTTSRHQSVVRSAR